MSTKIFGTPHNSFTLPHVRYSKNVVVSTEQESLADFVRRVIKEKNLRYRQISERSGGGISPSTISDIISGKTQEIKSGTISALAVGLGVSEREILTAISRKAAKANGNYETSDSDDAEKEEIERLYFRKRKLTPKRKAEFARLLAMVDKYLDELEAADAEEQ